MADQWEEWDKRDLMQRLGVLPAPGQTEPSDNPE